MWTHFDFGYVIWVHHTLIAESFTWKKKWYFIITFLLTDLQLCWVLYTTNINPEFFSFPLQFQSSTCFPILIKFFLALNPSPCFLRGLCEPNPGCRYSLVELHCQVCCLHPSSPTKSQLFENCNGGTQEPIRRCEGKGWNVKRNC